MGRAFEFRKERKMKRWGRMARTFTVLGKQLTMASKQGGPDPETNSRLRVLIQNAKNAGMLKDKVEAAIKRAHSKDERDFEEVVYEGYGPYGIAILVECATDNINRTVAAVRSYFTRAGGTLGKTGSLDFIFERKCVFKVPAEGNSVEDLELELIDFGADEVFEDEGSIYIYTPFTEFGAMQKALEERNIEIQSAEIQRFPNSLTELTPDQQKEILALVDKFEEDDDVQAVYHNMKEDEE
jgi:YebC/PmpR family DNA-binding regulatory protein